jgi:TIR domain
MAINQRTAQFFISYAREDKAFAVKLRRSLAARGRLAWLDLKNIKALALWRKEIAAAIDAADVFVFILSPDAVASAACRKELRLAVEAKKRLAPLVWREPDAKSVPPALRAPNWLFIRHRESTDRLVERLIEAADRDPD